jgi:hypothetical protein
VAFCFDNLKIMSEQQPSPAPAVPAAVLTEAFLSLLERLEEKVDKLDVKLDEKVDKLADQVHGVENQLVEVGATLVLQAGQLEQHEKSLAEHMRRTELLEGRQDVFGARLARGESILTKGKYWLLGACWVGASLVGVTKVPNLIKAVLAALGV